MSTQPRLLGIGVVGSVVTALCCFTPLLVVVFGVLGISSWLGWIDWVLLPLLAGFVLVTAYALAPRNRRHDAN